MATLRCLPMSLVLLLVAAFGWSGGLQAKQSGLSPARIKQINKDSKSFENCRKDAIELLKQGKVSKKKFEVALNTCKESFPGADLYITCKKQAIQAAAGKKLAPDQAVSQCKRYLLATSYDPDNAVPFFAESGQLYFAGIGLNRSLPAAALAPPNFNCDKLQDAVHKPAAALYFLFGNHPQTFAGLSEVKPADLAKVLKLRKPPPDTGADVPGFGRLFGDAHTPNAVAYFPTAACDFDSEPGKLISGLSAYYLLDLSGNSATPYFGISYFHSEQHKTTTNKVVQGLLRAVGPGYKTYTKNAAVTFIAAAPITEVDEEQDPKNLCRQPRPHRLLGVVQGMKDKPTQPEYVLLANIKNLCDFGDRLGKRLAQ